MKKYVFESLKFFCAAILCTILSAFTTPARAALPSGYTELSYIESTGEQYIDTQYTMTNTSGIKIVIDDTATNSPKASTAAYFVGASLQGSYMGYFTRVSNNMVASVWAWNGENVLGTDITSTHSTVYINYMNDRKFIYNNGTRDYVREGDLPTLKDATGSLYLFNTSSGGGIYSGVGKMYSAQITENQSIVRNLIPAKNSSGVVGMYDTVNNQFYTNAGDGEFIAGPEACEGERVTYTSATGTGTQSGTPTPTNPIEPTFYKQGNMVLRKVGDYADTYDATTGKITRRVGVKVLDGTENTINTYNMLQITAILNPAREKEAGWQRRGLCTHAVAGTATNSSRLVEIDATATYFGGDFGFTAASGKQWLRDQYAAGTPVTLYYPLAEPVEEDWPASYCETPIKIATTKYNETAFSPLNTALQNAISVVDSVVSNTITQAASIATLQAQKQTRPNDIADDNEKCPAGKKCLLVEDASGVPHWYEIVERYSLLPDGYTELQWIESTGTQYIDTGVYASSNNLEIYLKTQANGDLTTEQDIISNYGEGASSSTKGRGVIGYYQNYIFAYARNSSTTEQNSIVTPTNINDILDIYVNYDYNNSIKTLKVNGVANTTSYTQGVSTNSYTFDLFHQKAASSVSFFKGKMYYCKIIIDGILAFNGIPAKNASGVIGMYDTVSGQFFTNQGEGSFIAGDPVSE